MEQGKNAGEGLLAMAIGVLQLLAVMFLHLARLIVPLPARPPTLDDGGHVGGLSLEVRAPTLMGQERARAVVLPDLHARAPHAPRRGSGPRTRHTVGHTPASTGRPLGPRPCLPGPQSLEVGDPVVARAMGARLAHQHRGQSRSADLGEAGLVAIPSIATDQQRPLGGLLTESRPQACGRMERAVLLRVAVAVAHCFPIQGHDPRRARFDPRCRDDGRTGMHRSVAIRAA